MATFGMYYDSIQAVMYNGRSALTSMAAGLDIGIRGIVAGATVANEAREIITHKLLGVEDSRMINPMPIVKEAARLVPFLGVTFTDMLTDPTIKQRGITKIFSKK